MDKDTSHPAPDEPMDPFHIEPALEPITVPLADWLLAKARKNRRRHLDSWLTKARYVRGLADGEPWPDWSTSEVLAVAIITGDTVVLAEEEYTEEQALEQLRHHIGEPSTEAARTVLTGLRDQL